MRKVLLIGEGTSAKGMIPALVKLQGRGFSFILSDKKHVQLLEEQEITFSKENPQWDEIDFKRSAFVGANALAKTLGVQEFVGTSWKEIVKVLAASERKGRATRKTRETEISASVELEGERIRISTGIEFFDHMLEQVAKHGGMGVELIAKGDLGVDDHHTVEDTALVLGTAIREALGDKIGIARYGFWLPMDEAEARVTLDLSGRPFCVFKGEIPRPNLGALSTEMVPHFFQSLSVALNATIHVDVEGKNTHHIVESTFKALGRALRMAIAETGKEELASTKGSL